MRRILAAILINALALWVAARWVPGFSVSDGVATFLVAGLVLGLLNGLVKPVLKILAFPLMMLTLGLFSLVINGLLLWALTAIVPSVTANGIIPLALATLVITAVNVVLNKIT